ncbi:hypothetical protein QZH41_007817 [Actinostola sp. cb2023]|nr:hypothetical protein QZH41_007817 [Actinostola sp. cb2023]
MLQEGVPEPRISKQGSRNMSESFDQPRPRNFPRQDQSRSRNFPDRPGRPPNRPGDGQTGFDSRTRSRSPNSKQSSRIGERDYRQDVQGRGRGGFRGRGRGGRGRTSNYGRDERQIEVMASLPTLLGESPERFQRLKNERANTRESTESGQRYQRDSFKGNSYGNDVRHLAKGYRQESSLDGNMSRQRGDPLMDESCIHLFGLPFQITEKEIFSFFKVYDVVKVKLLYHPSGRFAGKKTGEGYVEFRSVRDSSEAATKNKQHIGNRYVEIRPCSKMAMMNASERNDLDLQRALDSHSVDGDSRYGPMSKHPVSDLAINIDTDLLKQDLDGRRLLNRGLTLPDPYLSTESPELQTLATLNQLASTANINPDDVAAGCVVGIRNLPSTITAEELLDFFYAYVVFQDSVRIHFLAPGRSSGDAMVTLRNSREATTAIQELNHKLVGKRSVQLFLV